MSEALSAVINNVSAYIGGSGIIWFYLISVIYILIADKHKRKSVIYPTLILMLIVVNPISYQYIWKRLLETTYWRTLWMIPIIIIIAYAMVSIILTAKNYIIKGVMVIAFVAIICFCGDNMYRYDVNFDNSANAYKLPGEVIEVADILLEQENEPRVIVQSGLYEYIRQYSSSIKLMYGRDVDGYIDYASSSAYMVNGAMHNSYPVISTIKEYGKGYKYIVLKSTQKFDDKLAEDNGFSLITETQNYKIYKIED